MEDFDLIQKEEQIQRHEQKQKEKKKKKKKNKKRKKSQDKQAQEQKIRQAIKNSYLHTVEELSPEERKKYAQVQNNPLKLICMNLPLKITIQEIIQYFNTVISASNPQLANPPPIKDVQIEKTRTFAILQLSQRRIKDFFRSHTDFTYIEGKTTFKIVKPKAFFEQKYGKKKPDEIIKNQITLSTSAGDNKIYLGGLPLFFTDAQVRKICQTFGKLKFFNLVKEGNTSKGYCFYEYEDPSQSQKAIQALNNLPVADKRLKCQRATIGNKNLSLAFIPSTQSNLIQEIQQKPANHSGSFLLSYENIRDPHIQITLSNDPQCKIPSRVVQFLNMFYVQDLFDDETYQDIKADLLEQCSKYGPVDKIVIPRPDPICGYAIPSVGKAFVKFMYIIPAKRARLAIAGKVYNKRTVVTSFYPEQKFNQKEYLVSI